MSDNVKCSICGTVHNENPDCASMCRRYQSIQELMACVDIEAKLAAQEILKRERAAR